MVKNENILKKSGEWLLKPIKEVFCRSVYRASTSKTFSYREEGENARTGLFSLRFQKKTYGVCVLSAAVTHAEGSGEIP